MKLLPTCYVSLIVMTAMMAGCNKTVATLLLPRLPMVIHPKYILPAKARMNLLVRPIGKVSNRWTSLLS